MTKAEYQRYINSPEWRRTRDRYWSSKLPTDCYCCGRPRHPGMHLHHRTYKNLGAERLMDLVPVCAGCHDEIHRLHRGDPRWKSKGLWYVTKHVRKMKQPTARRKTG